MSKQKIIAFILALLMLVVPITALASSSVASKEEQKPSTEAIYDLVLYFSNLSKDPTFGGMYYEEDSLVVNIVKDEFTDCQQNQSLFDVNTEIECEYRYVPYSLDYLEQVKDSLVPFMNSLSISVLDANEVTNQVDVYLARFDDQTKSTITQFINDTFGVSDFLHFIDYSNVSIQYTVAYGDEIESAIHTADARVGLYSGSLGLV